jgi:hypothetical protein
VAKFTVGPDEDSDGSGTMRTEVPMGDDDNQISEPSQGGTSEIVGELGKWLNGRLMTLD